MNKAVMALVLATTALVLTTGVSARVEADEATLHVAVTKQQRSAEACDDNCERDWMPVCGSDGVTYGNDCLLEFANCENATISRVSKGKCLKQH